MLSIQLCPLIFGRVCFRRQHTRYSSRNCAPAARHRATLASVDCQVGAMLMRALAEGFAPIPHAVVTAARTLHEGLHNASNTPKT